ncbi:hypothetical protein H4CHR_02911 [Variovorax sp. PBS-H4]|uniref:DUF2958 domain-containing protein n=1 Tax=Variovorax sp. PBS-H4 TaxID=434008 RepID=UPI0013176CDF|nr:DUF2958 domain-containing protein [Variovorax sp. PBS-H4]VTU31948.1 hypothetical protein H4CHR_02911 [Variovorax sp. PBS-H4]
MNLWTPEQLAAMVANNAESRSNDNCDHYPVVKLFTPDAGATWLLTEIDEEEDLAFGLCDLGLGYPELGYVSISELRELRGRLGMPIERDISFVAKKPLSEYAKEAIRAGVIVT